MKYYDVNSVLWLLHLVVVGDVVDVSEVHVSAMEEACTSEKSEASHTTTWCNSRRTELTSVLNHLEILKS
jgi:uncharacterized membrane protein